MGSKLIFVYNVDATPMAMLRDLYQGLTTGSTDCHLCDVTYGKMLKDRQWSDFVKGLPLKVEFRLRSTFGKLHPERRGAVFPAAFLQEDDGSLRQLISAEEINGVADVASLRELVERKVATLE